MKTWKSIKQRGSKHYKKGGVELIDVFKDLKPHPSLTVLDIYSLCNAMKYPLRQLTRGKRKSDLTKIHHYIDMAEIAGGKVI